MRRQILILLVAVFSVSGLGAPLLAQDYGTLPDSIPNQYEVAPMDRVRFSDASAVVRLGARRLVIEDSEESTLYVRKVVTILKEDGRHHGRLVLPYDTFREIEDLEGRVLDADGNEVKDLDDEHINDYSAIRSYSLYSDARVREATLVDDRYPYTVEYRYELEMTSPFWWPTWYPMGRDAPTEFAQYEVDAPVSLSIRHHVRGDSLEPTVTQDRDRRSMRWRVSGRSAYRKEPYGPSWREQAPSVHVAPSRFTMAESRGDMRSWEGLGAWYHRLKESRDALGPDATRQMKQLVKGASTARDSVRRLYRHLQKETRYVGVQLGIGGWQPFPPSYVRERGYGDCKALTNYMEASLEAVGISAHPVLISAGEDAAPVRTEFPSNQFNHVVLAVPLVQDTLWLENTDTTAPFGHVPASIEDRYGLMISSNGGELVRTPATQAEDNREVRAAIVSLQTSGDGTASIQTTFTGNRQDRVRRSLVDASPRDRVDWLRDRIPIPNYDIVSADFSDVDAYRDSVWLPIKLDLPRYASKTGSRLFLSLNLMQRTNEVPPEIDGARAQPVHAASYPYVEVDSIHFEMPPDYGVEAVPDAVSIETNFATYEAEAMRRGNTLVYHRRLVWRKDVLSSDQYEAFRNFRREVTRADRMQAVLVKEKS